MNAQLQPLSPDIINFNKLAVIIERDDHYRDVMSELLCESGYRAESYPTDDDLLELCHTEQPFFIFISLGSLQQPESGPELIRKIRRIHYSEALTIVIVTSDTDAHDLMECMEAGADDIVQKPFSSELFQANLLKLAQLRELRQEANSLTGQMLKDQEMAEVVFSGAVLANNVAEDEIRRLIKPASLFSGDVLLTAYAPSKDLHVLLGDFTGHGLAAAIGALPTSETFRAMTQKGFHPYQILASINRKLHGMLPTGMFLAAQFLSISHDLSHVTLFNCGMPDILLIEGKTSKISKNLKSNSLPLGILEEVDFHPLANRFSINEGDSILLVSDGVTEACNPAGEYFGQKRIEEAIQTHLEIDNPFDRIIDHLNMFCQSAPQNDDISLAEIPISKALLPDWDSEQMPQNVVDVDVEKSDPLELHLKLNGKRLRDADPIPMLVNQLHEIEGFDVHRRQLFTILTELYVNALDHGVLGMNSSLKANAEGFSRYFSLREQRLNAISDGYVEIEIVSYALKGSGTIIITISDSGKGFSVEEFKKSDQKGQNPYSGRGIKLVESLCDSLIYRDPGNMVTAIYNWFST